ncbi:hypothetical protein SDC9_185627 [bioreactor metagenome]|uniref:Uncharacterized protein n=1 Tax=bioreactor metagenome TaxID=1076179 RepID=A0A645HRU5_9ZZZZ
MLDTAEIEMLAQQLAQWCVVEQRARWVVKQPAHGQGGEPAYRGAPDADRVGAVDVIGMHAPPESGEDRGGLAEIVGKAGDADHVDGACRRAAENGEGVVPSIAR